MPQIVKKRRSGWAILAAGALVASLLAVGSAPAGAAEIKTGEDDNKAEPSVEPTYSACPVGSDALVDAGFTDLGDLGAAVDDINCLAHYKITTGRTTDTFDPNSNVTREHMALFLYRAANKAGRDLMGGDGDADFGDIAELGEDRQNAINALARNGILAGRSDMAFDPHSDITRAEMAVALVGLAKHANPGLFNKNGTLKIDASDLDHFADSRAAVPVAIDSAISYAYELGITTGYGDATFRPSASVPRRNMASFIMRTLDHTNTRPAGVTAQVIGGDSVVVSVRTSDFEPVDNAPVDAFAVAATRSNEAFDDGECTRLVKTLGGDNRCEIDDQDEITDADGQAELLVPVGDAIPGLAKTGAIVWVWTGDDGDEVDSGTAIFELDVPPTPPKVTASSAKISSNLHKAARMAGFGDTVTYTVQLQGLLGGDTVDAPPDKDGTSYTLKVTYAINGRVTVEDVEIGKDGSATFSLTHSDPNPDEGGQTGTINYELSVMKNSTGVWAPDCDGGTDAGCTGGDNNGEDDRALDDVLSDLDDDDVPEDPVTEETVEARTARPEHFNGSVTFSDAASVATTVVAMADAYDYAPGANRSARSYVTVVVLDQFGSGVRGVPVYLADYDAGVTDDEATGSESTFLERARHTVSSGATRVPFTVENLETGIQTIQAIADVKNNGVGDDTDTADVNEGTDDISSVIPDPAAADEFLAAATTIYWVSEGGTSGVGEVVQGDLDGNELVVKIVDAYRVVIFDSGDQFEVFDETDDTNEVTGGIQCARSFGLDAFTRALGGDSDLSDDAKGAVSVSWTSYSADDSAVVAGWRLTVEATDDNGDAVTCATSN